MIDLGSSAHALPVVEVVVHHGRQEVVGRGDGVEVAGQMEVQGLERDHLAVATSGGSPLDPEGRAHRRLPECDRGPAPDAGHGLTETDRRGRLALPQGGRGDRGDHDVSCAWPAGQRVDGVEVDLRDVMAVRLEQVGIEAHLLRDVRNRAQRGMARDLYGGGQRHRKRSCQTARGTWKKDVCPGPDRPCSALSHRRGPIHMTEAEWPRAAGRSGSEVRPGTSVCVGEREEEGRCPGRTECSSTSGPMGVRWMLERTTTS